MGKEIKWSSRSKEEREYYEYYLSLGYDERTAAVLALFTYGQRRFSNMTIDELYQKIIDQMEEAERFRDIERRSARPTSAYTYADGAMPDSMPQEKSARGFSRPKLQRSSAKSASPRSGGKSASPLSALFEGTAFARSAKSAPKSAARFARAERLEAPVDAEEAGTGFSAGNMMMFEKREMETDEYDPIEEKDFRSVASSMTSTFRMTTNTASAGVILNQLRNERRIDASMVRIEEMLNYFRYKSEKPESEKFKISYELKGLNDGKKLLYINVQGREEVKSRQNIVILLDVSGSMSGNAKKTQAMVATIISKLNPGDKLSLVTYSSNDEVVFRGKWISSEEDKIKALETFLGLEIYGGTYGSAGIETAYEIGKEEYIEDGNNQVILITDGDLNFGITDRGGLEELIEEKKKSNLFLSVIGTGLYNYKDNKLETLSKHGNGVYRTVNNLADVKKCIDAEYASLVNVIAKDVKAQVEFNPEVVESYRLLGFENREISHEDFVNDKVISEPFGSGGYGVALYELVLRTDGKPVESGYKYAKVVTTGSTELGTVKVRYKEPLEDSSNEIECVITSAQEDYTDNLRLAYVVYVCAEKLRGSDKITKEDIKKAQEFYDELGEEIREMNEADLYKLPEILKRTARELHVGIRSTSDFDW